jgi:hypothetical protein
MKLLICGASRLTGYPEKTRVLLMDGDAQESGVRWSLALLFLCWWPCPVACWDSAFKALYRSETGDSGGPDIQRRKLSDGWMRSRKQGKP